VPKTDLLQGTLDLLLLRILALALVREQSPGARGHDHGFSMRRVLEAK
jgi:hypothetical protein